MSRRWFQVVQSESQDASPAPTTAELRASLSGIAYLAAGSRDRKGCIILCEGQEE